ncbi:MAG: TIGR02206 family membrane protein [Tissierellia bacterium]|nr:TIGR02206 family membrane protein [Tissierellia bacterium]
MFSHVEATNNFRAYGPLHISIIAITILIMLFSFKMKRNKIYEKSMVFTIGLCQIILFTWYLTGTKFYEEGLPFYTCRLSGVFFVISYFFDKKSLKACGVYLGFVGGIMAILTPEMYPYSMLHFTNLNFFFYHICLLSISSYYMVHEKDDILNRQKNTQKIVFVLLILIAILNSKIGTNYSYTAIPPVARNLFQKLNWFVYFFILVMLYQISIIIEAKIMKKIDYKKRVI